MDDLENPLRTGGARTMLRRLWHWLPDSVDRRVRFMGWLSLAWEVLLVATGGLVRLTGSGLGCPTWPRCTPDSLTNTPEMGIHGFIEFGNRMLTVALTVIVIVMFLLVLRLRTTRPELFWLSFWIGMSIPAQAVLGGITVLADLNPYIVGVHFAVSMALVVLATILVVRIHAVPGPRRPLAPPWFMVATWAAAVFVGLTVLVGILTTGAGPHPGNTGTPRNGLDLDFLERLHSLPGYIAGGLTLLVVGASIGLAVGPVRHYLRALVIAEVVQIALGLLQVNVGIPPLLVSLHMIVASVVVALATAAVMALTGPVGVAQNGSSGSIATARKSTVR